MSRFGSLFAAVGLPSVRNVFGRSVTRWPLGVSASAATITGVVVDFEDEGGMVMMDNGEAIPRTGYLEIPVSVSLNIREAQNARDHFVIDSELWRAEGIVASDENTNRVLIRRVDSISRTRART